MYELFFTSSVKILKLFNLRILALEKLGAVFNQVAYNLEFTPRKFVVHPESGL